MEIREILRQIRAGESDHAIRRNLGVHRTTVKKYRTMPVAVNWRIRTDFPRKAAIIV
jgi:FixJ family two-component response regulator